MLILRTLNIIISNAYDSVEAIDNILENQQNNFKTGLQYEKRGISLCTSIPTRSRMIVSLGESSSNKEIVLFILILNWGHYDFVSYSAMKVREHYG